MAPENRLALASVMMKAVDAGPDDGDAVQPAERAAEDERRERRRVGPAGRASASGSRQHHAQTPIEPTARFMPPVASTTICEKPMTMSMASERPSAKRLKRREEPRRQRREDDPEDDDDDEQADCAERRRPTPPPGDLSLWLRRSFDIDQRPRQSARSRPCARVGFAEAGPQAVCACTLSLADRRHGARVAPRPERRRICRTKDRAQAYLQIM